MEGVTVEDVKWTPEMEVVLFKAMQDHKPVGLNKHWHMLCIHHRMIRQGGVVVTIKAIWDHLQSLYDLASLDETDTTSSFLTEEQEFELPRSFFESDENDDSFSNLVRKRGRNSMSPSPSASPHNVTKKKRTQ